MSFDIILKDENNKYMTDNQFISGITAKDVKDFWRQGTWHGIWVGFAIGILTGGLEVWLINNFWKV